MQKVVRTKIITISVCLLLGIASVSILPFLSKQDNAIGLGFSRPNMEYLELTNWIDMKSNTYYFSGFNSDEVFLSSYESPMFVLAVDKLLKNKRYIQLNIPQDQLAIWQSTKTTINYPEVYILEGTTPLFLYSSTLGGILEERILPEGSHFDTFIPLSDSLIVCRMYDQKLSQNTIASLNLVRGTITPNAQILQKQIDGRFCTDGVLLKDDQLKILIYLYFYRNQYSLFDYRLNIIDRRNTIDTIQQARISLTEIPAEKLTTFSTPPLTTNKGACANAGNLYVHSSLMSDSDDPAKFKEHCVIDTYSINDGRYVRSLYLPNSINGEKLHSFKVSQGCLYAIYEQYLAVFMID